MESIKERRCYRYKLGGIILLSLATTLLIILSGCGGGGGSSSSITKGSIHGTVRNSEGTSLPGATITAGGKTVTANNYGNFIFDNASVGTQTISASLVGYFNDGRGSASIQIVAGSNTNVSDLILVPTSNGEVFIWHLKASSSDYSAPKQKQLGGTIYYDSLLAYGWNYSENNPAEAIYSLGRRYSRFKATVGVADDNSDLNTQVVFKVVGDGNTLYQSGPLKVGVIDNVDVDVSNVLTLQLKVAHIANTGDRTPDTIWGNARLSTK